MSVNMVTCIDIETNTLYIDSVLSSKLSIHRMSYLPFLLWSFMEYAVCCGNIYEYLDCKNYSITVFCYARSVWVCYFRMLPQIQDFVNIMLSSVLLGLDFDLEICSCFQNIPDTILCFSSGYIACAGDIKLSIHRWITCYYCMTVTLDGTDNMEITEITWRYTWYHTLNLTFLFDKEKKKVTSKAKWVEGITILSIIIFYI